MTQPLIFGEVLFDRFPDGNRVLGGAPFNVAWNLTALGLAPLLVSRVGDDPLGREIRDRMHQWGMSAAGLQQDSAHPTGTVDVSLHDGEPSFSIVPDQAYDHIAADSAPPLREIGLIYHGSLAVREADSRAALRQIRASLGAPVFVDVNLRPPWWRRDQVLGLLQGATWAKLNHHELEALGRETGDMDRRAERLRDELGLQVLFVTRGAEGALAYTQDGQRIEAPMVPCAAPQDAVGAGDAFASVLILGLMRGWPLPDTLRRAQGFASRVVGLRGATTSERGFYRLDD